MQDLSRHLSFIPTSDQSGALSELEKFLENPDGDAFVLRGSAGTGKTSMLLAIAEHLSEMRMPCRLLAPTARAAKVLSDKTNRPAATIHSTIYVPEHSDAGELVVRLRRRNNDAGKQEIFVIDEASMVGAKHIQGGRLQAPGPLLDDLIRFAKQGDATSKLVFVGDPFQLPPVNERHSEALDIELLKARGLSVQSSELHEVKRQASDSWVLGEATRLRESIRTGGPAVRPRVRQLQSSGSQIRSYLDRRLEEGDDSSMMIAWTNRDVQWMNGAARDQLGVASKHLAPKDPVILNHHYAGPDTFLVNGEQGTIVSVGTEHEFGGLNFAEVEVSFDQAQGESLTVVALALIDVLLSKRGELTADQEKTLHAAAMRSNVAFRTSRMASDDPHVGALRLRYAHALTAHKAQGGEWEHVFMHPYCGHRIYGADPRWLYTALTRSRAEVYSYRHPYPHVDFLAFLN